MKKRSILVVAMLAVVLSILTASLAFAQSGDSSVAFSTATEDLPVYPPLDYSRPQAVFSMTQSVSQSVVPGTVRCATTGTPFQTDNWFYRVFDPADFGITTPYDISSVDVAIENANAEDPDTSSPMDVTLYTTSANPPVLASLTQVATVTAMVPDTTLSILNVPISGSFNAGDVLVVEVFTPDGDVNNPGVSGDVLTIGSNGSGENDPSYIRANPCGLTEIGTFAGIGFPNVHLVMNVYGDTVTPTDVSLTSFGQSGSNISWLVLVVAIVASAGVLMMVGLKARREDLI